MQAQQAPDEQRHELPLEDDGLERDIRAVLNLDDPQEDSTAPETGSDQSTQETTDAKEGETPDADDDSEQELLIDIGGEKVPLSQVQEWRRGYLRESDYTRKTQRLSERERELQQAMQQVQPMLQLQQLLQSNPAAFRAFQTAYQTALQGQATGARPGASTTPYSPQVPFQTPMPAQMDPEIQQLRQVAADYQLDRQLNELRKAIDEDRKTFGLKPATDEEWQQAQERVMREAVEARIPDLSMAYRASTLRDQLYQEGLRAIQGQRQEQQRAATAQQAGAVMRGRGVPSGGVKPPASTPKTLADATRQAFAELQAAGGLLANE